MFELNKNKRRRLQSARIRTDQNANVSDKKDTLIHLKDDDPIKNKTFIGQLNEETSDEDDIKETAQQATY